MVNKKLVVILVILFVVNCFGGVWLVLDNWLTNNNEADYNHDGIINFIDYAVVDDCYGYLKYGLYDYGN